MPVPAGLGDWRQGEQVCPGSLLLQQALLSNAGVERLSCNTSLPPATTAATAMAPALPLGGTHPTHRDPWGWGMRGQISPTLKPTSNTPKRPLAPALVECGHREPNPPRDGVPLLSGKGWLGKSIPILTGVISAQEGCQRQIPVLAPLFRQSVGRGGSQLMTRFQTGSAGTVPGLLNAPLLPRGTGHPPAGTPTEGPQPPLLASPWHSWGESRTQWRGSRNWGAEQQPQCSGIRNQQSPWPNPPRGSGTLPHPATGCLAQGKRQA